jgi:integrative and conjugative element protein (TIGR02256 family)
MSPVQSKLIPSGTAWISSAVLNSLVEMANSSAPLETGGVLLGYWSESPVVLDAVGPGPKARHDRFHFLPDQGYHEAEIARLYRESNCSLQYLGDWHSHPGQSGVMSKLDIQTLRRIANSRKARASRPIMLILAYGPDWKPVVWSLRKAKRLFGVYSYVTESWTVASF